MSDTRDGYKLDELATAAGVSPRTVRYYVQRGLLPAPAFRGRDTAYGREHLLRLRAIRALQAKFLPLDAIADAMSSATAAQLAAWAEGRSLPAVTASAQPAVTASAQPEAETSPVPVTRGSTWRLAEGLTLHLDDGADEGARSLAETVLALVARRNNEGERR